MMASEGCLESPLRRLGQERHWSGTPDDNFSREVDRRQAEFERIRLEFQKLESIAAKVNPVLTLTGHGRRLKDHMAILERNKQSEYEGLTESQRQRQDEEEYDLVVKQLEVMAEEKARLKEENARLWREYSSLCDIVTVGLSLEDTAGDAPSNPDDGRE